MQQASHFEDVIQGGRHNRDERKHAHPDIQLVEEFSNRSHTVRFSSSGANRMDASNALIRLIFSGLRHKMEGFCFFQGNADERSSKYPNSKSPQYSVVRSTTKKSTEVNEEN